MSIIVNPPQSLKMPKKWQNDPELAAYHKNFDRMFLQLWLRTGGPVDQVAAAKNTFVSGSISAHILQLKRELEGLPELTVDTTGFTADLTFITADKVAA